MRERERESSTRGRGKQARQECEHRRRACSRDSRSRRAARSLLQNLTVFVCWNSIHGRVQPDRRQRQPAAPVPAAQRGAVQALGPGVHSPFAWRNVEESRRRRWRRQRRALAAVSRTGSAERRDGSCSSSSSGGGVRLVQREQLCRNDERLVQRMRHASALSAAATAAVAGAAAAAAAAAGACSSLLSSQSPFPSPCLPLSPHTHHAMSPDGPGSGRKAKTRPRARRSVTSPPSKYFAGPAYKEPPPASQLPLPPSHWYQTTAPATTNSASFRDANIVTVATAAASASQRS